MQAISAIMFMQDFIDDQNKKYREYVYLYVSCNAMAAVLTLKCLQEIGDSCQRFTK